MLSSSFRISRRLLSSRQPKAGHAFAGLSGSPTSASASAPSTPEVRHLTSSSSRVSQSNIQPHNGCCRGSSRCMHTTRASVDGTKNDHGPQDPRSPQGRLPRTSMRLPHLHARNATEPARWRSDMIGVAHINFPCLGKRRLPNGTCAREGGVATYLVPPDTGTMGQMMRMWWWDCWRMSAPAVIE